MINIIKQEIPIDESLKKKLEFICDFCNTTPTFINESIRKIDKSNLAYVEPHKVIINNIMFLVFNYSNDVYIKNFGNKIKINELEDYFNHISNNEKNDLACEIIIELGDKKYWDTKDDKFKRRMTNVYKKQIEDSEIILPTFKIASAVIHYDETSPHLHIVGVPIKFNNKNGMKKQVGKSDVFTKESLRKLQDKMRTLCI